MMVVLPKTTHNIGDTLSAIHTEEKGESRKMLLNIEYTFSRKARFFLSEDVMILRATLCNC